MFYNNSSKRTALDKCVTKTVLFKTIYPDLATFETALTSKGIPTDANTAVRFAYLQEMIGNAYLKATTDTKNHGILAWNWKKYSSVLERQKQIFDKTLDQMNEDGASATSKLFRVNRSLNGELEAKFLDSGQTSDQTAKGNLLAKFAAIEEWAQRTDPELRFISNIAQAIVLPYQPESYGEVY